MKKLLIFFTVLAGLLQSSHQQGLDNLEECVASDDTFLLDLLGCFAIKFQDLLGGISIGAYEAQDVYTGRRLQGFAHADDAIRNNFVVPRMLERFQKTHKKFMENMVIVGQLAQQANRDKHLLEKIKDLNLRMELRTYLNDLLMMLTPIRGRFDALKQQAVQQLHSKKGLADDMKAFRIDDNLVETLCFYFPDLCPLLKMGACLNNQDEEAFEDGLSWLYCVYECADLPKLSMCMVELFNSTDSCQRVDWLSDILIRGFVEFVGLGECAFEVLTPQVEPLVLTEGGPSTNVDFITYMPPGAMCYGPNMLNNPLSLVVDVVALSFGFDRTCDVQIQFSTSMYLYNMLPFVDLEILGSSILIGRPKCGLNDMQALNQIAIGQHEHAAPVGACVIQVNEQNWNETFSVPLTAVVDHKLDGDVTLNFTMKYVVEGTTHYTQKILVTAVDNDPAKPSVCSSVNDPHVTTFDGFYYNNLYHGYFYLYKHTSLPYQVQVIQQACSTSSQESCTCAVAVQSGDDVFVVDRCRRTPASCSGGNCHPFQATFYTNGELTPNTRVIHKDGGMGYDVILPHGTVVKIAASRDLLNVWITPSSYDRNQTTGLCGLYNEIVGDDLLLPNGTVYAGNGSTSRGQPRPFNLAWRVPVGERIFQGTVADTIPFEPLSSCRCTHVIFEGVTCDCEGGQMVETCDMNLDGELTDDSLEALIRHSMKAPSIALQSMSEGTIDVDEAYEPGELEWKAGNPTESEAVAFCNDLLDNNDKRNEIIRLCNSDFGPSTYLSAKYACIEDIQITGGYDWQYSALDSAKLTCLSNYKHSVTYGEDTYSRMNNSTCIQDCNGNGDCVMGACTCGPDHAGPDCSLPAGIAPSLVIDKSAVCDKRTENCYFSTVYGQNFLDDGSIQCHVQAATVDANGIRVTDQKVLEVDVMYISPNQIICRLPTNGSYIVEVKWKGQSISSVSLLSSVVPAATGQLNFLSTDSACYSCNPEAGTCSVKTSGDFCIIKEGCYAHMEVNPANDCELCDSSVSTSAWTDKKDDRCDEVRAQAAADHSAWQRDRQIRIGVACGLSGLVVIVVVIIYVVQRKREKRLAKERPIEIIPVKTDIAYYEEPNTNANNASQGAPSKHVSAYENAGLSMAEEPDFSTQNEYSDLRVEAIVNHAGRERHGSSASQRSETRKNRATSTGSRERTGSVGSARSIGIGGGGPAHFNAVGGREINTGLQGGSLSLRDSRAGGERQEERGDELIARF